MPNTEFTSRLCDSQELLWLAQNIRYQAYVDVGYEPMNAQGLFQDRYDSLDNQRTYLLYHHGRPMATIRASIACVRLGWRDLCCRAGFDEQISALEQRYDAVIEMNRLAVLPSERDYSASAPLHLFATVFELAKDFDSVLLCCASGRHHQRFYQRLGFSRQTDFAPMPDAAIELALMTKTLTNMPAAHADLLMTLKDEL